VEVIIIESRSKKIKNFELLKDNDFVFFTFHF